MISGGFPNYQIPPPKKLSEWVAVFTLSTSISTTCRICWSKVKAFNQETSPGKTNSSLFRVAKVWNNILAWKKWRFGFPPKKCVGRMNDNLILIFWNFLSPFRCKDNPERSGVRCISENPQPERMDQTSNLIKSQRCHSIWMQLFFQKMCAIPGPYICQKPQKSSQIPAFKTSRDVLKATWLVAAFLHGQIWLHPTQRKGKTYGKQHRGGIKMIMVPSPLWFP